MVIQITVQAGTLFQVAMRISLESSQDGCRIYLGGYGGGNK